jgi:hypothetical protein
MRPMICIIAGLFMLGLGACGSAPERAEIIRQAGIQGMVRMEIPAGEFTLISYQRITQPGLPTHLYIEGDGFAWITAAQPSADPTPKHPIGLALAIADHGPNVVYLARPCQFSLASSPGCSATYWTDRRFSSEMVDVMNLALDQISVATHGPFELIGYSGGGAIAVLLAARRSDILSIRTVAGNLDHEAVNRAHQVSPMPLSLNPISQSERIANIPQIHFIGEHDDMIPSAIATTFVAQQHSGCARIHKVSQTTHQRGWVEKWPELLQQPVHCD